MYISPHSFYKDEEESPAGKRRSKKKETDSGDEKASAVSLGGGGKTNNVYAERRRDIECVRKCVLGVRSLCKLLQHVRKHVKQLHVLTDLQMTT